MHFGRSYYFRAKGVKRMANDKWDGESTLIATDAANLWRFCKKQEINNWMKRFDREVRVKFAQRDDQKEITFVPIDGGADQKGLVISEEDRTFWTKLVTGASNLNHFRYNIKYRFMKSAT
jgi:hypothetical protein